MPRSSQPLLLRSPSSDSQDEDIERIHDFESSEVDRLRRSSHEKGQWSRIIRLKRHKRLVATIGLLLCLLIFTSFITISSPSSGDIQVDLNYEELSEGIHQDPEEPKYPAQVLGPPRDSLWDNLRNDTLYITGWYSAGWTNEVFIFFNLLYLAFLTGRTAIVPPFDPSHVSKAAPDIPISDVFDLSLLSRTTGIPIIEWDDVKSFPSRSPFAQIDQIGCWTVWGGLWRGAGANEFHETWTPTHWKLDVSYTHVPKHAKLYEANPNDPHVRLSSLAALTYPDGRRAAGLPSQAHTAAKESGHRKLPDEHLACFDFLYYASEVQPYEFQRDYSPVWRFIGTHAHWSPRLLTLTRTALAVTFDLISLPSTPSSPIQSYNADLPPFISLHVRHGDFAHGCAAAKNPKAGEIDGEVKEDAYLDCFESLSVWADRVDEIKKELKERKGIEVEKVLMMSDEKSERWWRDVSQLGWYRLDHEALGTEVRYGEWYPVFIDAVAQSLGAGFVGTDQSTMSLVAARRVVDWNGGIVRYVNRWSPEYRPHNH